MTNKEKKFVMDILKRYWPRKAFEIELAEKLKKELVETPNKPIKMKPIFVDVHDKVVTPNEPL